MRSEAPAPVDRQRLAMALAESYLAARPLDGGDVARYIPELGRVDPERFAIAACTPAGEVVSEGDAELELTLQSMCKPLLFAQALVEHGREEVHARVGVEPTGDAFNSIVRLDREGLPHNPMINAGAIAVAGMLSRSGVGRMLEHMGGYAGGQELAVDVPAYLSERASADRNRAIGHLLDHFGVLDVPVEEALDLYFQACAVQVSCRQLAVIAATLACGGVDPVTGERALEASLVRDVVSVMSTSGLYDASGSFAFEIGLVAKSGVSGGILAVVPDRLGLAVYSPRLDEHGNSLRGMAALSRVASRLGLHLFETAPPSDAVGQPVPRRRSRDDMERALADGLDRTRAVEGGELAPYAPELAAVDPDLFGVAACSVDGEEAAAGDAARMFAIQAAANPFGYALALREHGVDSVHAHMGVEPSGNPYNALVVDPKNGRPQNPLSNAGAIAVASLVPGGDGAARLSWLLDGMAGLAGEPLRVDAAMLAGERRAGARNRAIAHLLKSYGVLDEVDGALDLYFQQCSLLVSCRTLARMAATLAAGGLCPITGKRALEASLVRPVLTVMYTCGMHDASGRFAYRVGLPAKSGISGAIVAVVPGRMGVAVYSPRVDATAASVRGAALLEHLSRELGLSAFG
jgi:glutaminase A